MLEKQLPDSENRLGMIYTFYSYKGGVGRTMALVNIGVLMALEGHRVLLIDWDLEAPGLETFFLKSDASSVLGNPDQTSGILDLLEARQEKRSLSWCDCLLKVSFRSTTLHIISAGRKGEDYRKRVQQLDWVSLFEDHDVGNFLDGLREEWRRAYDFILIDSRTGITDVGDICTVLLPDAVVAVFAANYQNVDGIKASIERARAARRKLPVNRSMLMIVPLNGRYVSIAEYDESTKWLVRSEEKFSSYLKEWLPKEISSSEAVSKLLIPYVPKWSFGERIPVLESRRELEDPTSIGSAYLRLATLLSAHLDWYSVFAKTSTEDLRKTKIELDTVLRERKTLETRSFEIGKKARFRSVQVVLLAVLVLFLGLIAVYFINTTVNLSSELERSIAQPRQ
jgi:cellulose biosynthesis protein BcsQ